MLIWILCENLHDFRVKLVLVIKYKVIGEVLTCELQFVTREVMQ